jgi:CheY-like chemotaxis protein
LQQHALATLTRAFELPAALKIPARARYPTRVLIVDHDINSCASLKLMLLDLGYRSTCRAHSGARALALAGGFSPAIVLLELGLPDMCVYQLAQLMRRHASRYSRRLSLVAVAPRETHASGDLARAAGFDGYLAKPVGSLELASVLRHLDH